MTMLSLIARSVNRARCSPSAFRSTKPYLHQQLPTYAYSILRFDNVGNRDALSSQAGNSHYYERGGRHSQPLLLPQVAVAALAAASATAVSENKSSLCQGGGIASHDEEPGQHPNAAQQQGLQQPQQSNGFRPHPDSWVRKSLKGQPQMEAWLSLMNEVGHFFPAKGVSKEIGTNAKLAYSDWVVRFFDWHNAKYGTGQPAHLAMPSGVALGAEEAERARTAIPHHLTVLPPPSLRLLVEFLEAMFVSQPAGGASTSSGASKPYSRKGWRHAKGAILRLWAYRTKSAQIHLGIRNGQPVPENVRRLLEHNGFTLPPPEESNEVKEAIRAISVQIDQQELAITNAREYDVLQHRPEKKSYKENQLGDIIDILKTEPKPDDKAGWEAWTDRCSWGGILPSLDAIISEKFGGARGDTRRIIDLNKLYCFEAFCSTDDKDSSRFNCKGCQRASAAHTCPHEMMECLSFAYMKSKRITGLFQSSTVARHMDATQCPIAHTAWLLFVRDQIDECKDDYKNIIYEARTKADFHGIPLLHSSSKPTTMRNESAHTEVHSKYNRTDYKEQYKSMKRGYKGIDWQGEDEPWKVTSAGRHQACTQLLNGSGGQGGVSDEIAERTCNWQGKKAGTMHRYYADLPHIKALANLAGFPKDGSKGYYIHRAHKEPDAELLNMLWPELPAKIEEVIRQRNQYSKTDPRRPPDSKLQFLMVMNWLRRVFLQDVPFLMEAHPDHPTWKKHPLFKSDKFKAWKEEVLQFVQDSHMKGQDHNAKLAKDVALVYERQQSQQFAEQHKTNKRLHTIEEDIKGNSQDLKDIKEMLARREKEEKWRRIAGEFGQTNASQLEQAEQLLQQQQSGNPAATVPACSLPGALPSIQLPGQSPLPVESTANNPEDEITAIEQFIRGLRSKTLLKDVRALWTVWNTGQFPTAVRAGVQLPRGQSWRDLDAALYAKATSPVDDRYRKWAAKVGGVAGPGVSFMGRSKRREFLKGLEQAISDPSGPGESAVLASVQAEVDKDFNGEILAYAAARYN